MAIKGKSVAGANQRKQTKDLPLKVGKRNVEASLESAASQIGSSLMFRGDSVMGTPERSACDLGNYLSERCEPGPGGGRSVSKSGSQGEH